MVRRYELKKRAERQRETRRRIVEAAVALHTTKGPAHTTVSDIAERAGVQRHTVYAHFPDEASLFRDCSRHWREANPFPDVEAWEEIEEPKRRLRTALSDLYAWYESVEDDLAVFLRDISLHGLQAELMAAREQQRRQIARMLARGWPRRRAVQAAIGHALEFETWRSLVRRQGLSRGAAVDAMVAFVRSV